MAEEEAEQWITDMLNTQHDGKKMTGKQMKIVKAAIETFAEKGYAASSTSEIAQKAGVAEGTIFRHYRTKRDLLISIVGPTMVKLVAPIVLKDFVKLLQSSYPQYEDFLRAIIRNRLEFARNHLDVIKIMIHEIPFQKDLQAHLREHVADKVLVRFIEIINHFQQEGRIIQIPSVTVIRFTASVVIGFLLTRFLIMPEHDWDEEQEIELCVDFIMYGLSSRGE